MPHALREALRRVEPAVDVQVMGEVGCPPLENEDLELLAWIERENRILVSRNRRTMPQHFATHLQAGGRVPGILMVSEDFSMAELVDDLLLIWSASDADEWRDQVIYLPLVRR
jgi:hypothetical protein